MDKQLRIKLNEIFRHAKGVGKIVLVNTDRQDPNFTYLTQFTSGLFENDILVLESAGARQYTSELEYETAMLQRAPGIKITKLTEGNYKKLLSSELKGKRIGINGGFLPYATYMGLKKYKPNKIIDVSGSLEQARIVKTNAEIENIKKAVRVTKSAMRTIQKYFKAGMKETDLAKKFDEISSGLGSEGPSFPTIVCFGKNAALPHHFPDGTKLKKGDFILIDAGSRNKNYCSDITRTFLFGIKSREDYEKKMAIYNAVKQAQQLAISKIKQGVKGGAVDNAARDYINSVENGKYKNTFIHSLGHSIGIEVHDGSGRMLGPGSLQVLKEGMITSVEPGIYINGFGGVRIEDDVLVTTKGGKVL